MNISLIIPAYNEEALIEKTILSVLEAKKYLQKHAQADMEIIVVDNDSTDQTVEIVKRYGVKVVHEEKHNIATVRNTGAKHASHEILCFLDADSLVSRNIFYVISQVMESQKYIGGGTKFKLDRRNLTFSLIFVSSVLATHIIGLSGVLIYTLKETFEHIGGFNTQFYAAEDIDFVIKLRNHGREQGKKFKNIYNGYVITSSRKFRTISFRDLFLQGGLLLHKSLRENPEKCEQWYNATRHRDKQA